MVIFGILQDYCGKFVQFDDAYIKKDIFLRKNDLFLRNFLCYTITNFYGIEWSFVDEQSGF